MTSSVGFCLHDPCWNKMRRESKTSTLLGNLLLSSVFYDLSSLVSHKSAILREVLLLTGLCRILDELLLVHHVWSHRSILMSLLLLASKRLLSCLILWLTSKVLVHNLLLNLIFSILTVSQVFYRHGGGFHNLGLHIGNILMLLMSFTIVFLLLIHNHLGLLDSIVLSLQEIGAILNGFLILKCLKCWLLMNWLFLRA